MITVSYGKSVFRVINIHQGIFDEDVTGHTHGKYSYEIHYVTSGMGILKTREKSYPLKKNSLYVTGPDAWHEQLTDIDNPMSEYCLYLQTVHIGDDALSSIFLDQHFWIGKGNREIKEAFFQMLSLAEHENLFAVQKLSIYVMLLLNELATRYSPIIRYDSSATVDERKFYLIETTFLNQYDTITLGSLAQKLCLSERQTQRLLRKYYGKSFTEKKADARIDKAKLLLQQNTDIEKLSCILGYTDASAFVHAFKRATGMTPLKFKNNCYIRKDSNK